jgi:tetratricopeptide (TPR) repeat protein
VDLSPTIEYYLSVISDATHQKAPTTQLEIAQILMKRQFYTEAINLLLPLSHTDYESKLLLATAYIKVKSSESAREIIFPLLRSNPIDTGANLVLCELCYSLDDLPNLVTILHKFDTIPLNFSQYMQISRYYCILQDWQKAIHYLSLAHEQKPYDIVVLYCISLCYINLGNKREALYYISQAKWIDIENPIINSMIDAITQDLYSPPVDIAFMIPNDIANQKIEYIESSLNADFCKSYISSLWLANDIDWYLFTHQSNTSEKVVYSFSKCSHKKVIDQYKKLLLTTRLHQKQKFFLLKHAFTNKNISHINFTSNLRYKSIKNSLPKKYKNTPIIQKGFISALSFSLTFGFDFSSEIAKQLPANLSLVDENTCACMFFANTPHLKEACHFFGVPAEKVLSILQGKNENS